MSELIIRKCDSCGALVEEIDECGCACKIQCCGKEMRVLKANSVDAAFEKHVPNYEVNGDEIIASVNHVMDEDHYIEWIAHVYENRVCRVNLKPGDEPVAKFAYKPGATLYAMCNKHGLWKVEVQ